MTIDAGVLERLRARGEEVLTQISSELMSNPRFVKAMQGAVRGKEKLEEAASRAVKSMNIPTRSEFKRAQARIEALERDVAALRAKLGARAAPGRSARKAAPGKRRGKAAG
jgi:polyhydroxyalkanoate synthesis regulator phasin